MMMREIWEHHKGINRLTAKDGGGLVEEGEWINKSVPSASLGPAQSFKWVDVGSGVSTFSSLLFSSLLFLLLLFSAVRMADPTPRPASSTNMASLSLFRAQTPARACPAALEPRLIYGSIMCPPPLTPTPQGWSPFSSTPPHAQMLV